MTENNPGPISTPAPRNKQTWSNSKAQHLTTTRNTPSKYPHPTAPKINKRNKETDWRIEESLLKLQHPHNPLSAHPVYGIAQPPLLLELLRIVVSANGFSGYHDVLPAIAIKISFSQDIKKKKVKREERRERKGGTHGNGPPSSLLRQQVLQFRAVGVVI